jgi:SAM-dependent methyltransferase
VPDAAFEEPRLAAIYDLVNGDRSDLEVYAAIVAELGARSVLDVGCGTGEFACLLAARGIAATGADPALASLELARAKPGADRVRWLHEDAAALPPLQVDLAVMTGNVAQVFVTDEEWAAALAGVRAALRPGGRFVFETRDPEAQAWRTWNRGQTYQRVHVAGAGEFAAWCDLIAGDAPLVTFRWTYEFSGDGAVLTSESTLRFRGREEVASSLSAAGFTVEEIRDAPDRPGKEMVFFARRLESAIGYSPDEPLARPVLIDGRHLHVNEAKLQGVGPHHVIGDVTVVPARAARPRRPDRAVRPDPLR